MSAIQFRAALEQLKLTQAQAAELLDISVRSAHGYANGWPIPRTVEMAIAFLLSQQKKR